MSAMLLQMHEAAWAGNPGPRAASNGASSPPTSLVLLQTLESGKTGRTLSNQAKSSIQVWMLLQTYEGGMGGEPGNEAHGGYAFCAVAALALIGRAGELDLRRLVHWAAHRQVRDRL